MKKIKDVYYSQFSRTLHKGKQQGTKHLKKLRKKIGMEAHLTTFKSVI